MCKGSQQRQQSTQKPPSYVKEAYKDVVSQASKIANQPYKAYKGDLVAGLTENQQGAFNAIEAAQGIQNPYLANASQLSMSGSGAVTPMEFNEAAVSKYMNPYLNQVMDATLANINNQNAIQRQGVIGNQIAKGAFGGDRAGVAQAELARNQALAGNQTIAQLRSDAYNQALGMFNTQQQTDLSAQQNTAARQLQGAQLQAGLGGQAQSQALAGANALLQAGSLEQQQQQNELNAAYQQWQNKQAYPFQSVGWLGNIVTGVGNNAGGTTTTTTSPPSLLSGMVGLGTAALGAVSDRRAKTGVEPIGETYDGQQIYRFQYHGDPETRIGLMAQDVEHQHPEAVGRIGELKTVDYDAATRDAADRGKFAAGGGVGSLPYGAMDASAYIPVMPMVGGRGGNMPAVPGAPALGGQASGILPAGTTSSDWTKLGQGMRTAYDKMTGPAASSASLPAYGGLYASGGVVPGYADGGDVEYDIMGNPISRASQPPSATIIPFPKSDRGVVPVAGPDRGVNYAEPTYGPSPDARRVPTQTITPPASRGVLPALPPVPERVGPSPALAVGGDRAMVPGTLDTQFGQFVTRDDGSGQTRMPDTAAGIAMRANQRAAGDIMAASPAVAAARGIAPAMPTTVAAEAVDRGVAPPLRPRADIAAASQRNRAALDTAGVAPVPTPLAPAEPSAARRFMNSTGLSPIVDRATAALSANPKGGTYDPTPIGKAFGMDTAWFSPEVRSALIAAGLGIMGGTSRNPLVNIGQGGLQGVTQYNTLTGQGQAQQKIDLEQKRLDQERMLRERELDISKQAVDQGGFRGPGYGINPVTGQSYGALPNQTGGMDVVRGSAGAAPLPPPAASAAATATPLPPPAAPSGGAPAAPEAAAPVVPKRTAAEVAGLVGTDKDPIVAPPSVPSGLPVDTRLYDPALAPLAHQEAADVQGRTNAATARWQAVTPRLVQMDHAFRQLDQNGMFSTTGITQPARQQIGQLVVDVASVLGVKDSPKLNEIASNVGTMEDIKKLSRVLAGEMTAGAGQESFRALESSLASVPNETLSRVGFRRILEGAKAVAERDKEFADWMVQARSANRNASPAELERRFNDQYPPSLYAERAWVRSIDDPQRQRYLQRYDAAKANGDVEALDATVDKRYGRGSASAIRKIYGLN